MSTLQEDVVREHLKTIVDPELGVNIIDLGLVYGVDIQEGDVTVRMTLTSPACPLAGIIQECCLHLEHAVRHCRNLRDPEAVQSRLKEIGRLENEADRLYREAESGLFSNPSDLLTLIKWHELYGWLEETIDACKDVALVISEVVVKGT